MAEQDNRSRGPFAVGLMALHDKAFFERLIADPRGALTDRVMRGKLSLTDADVDEVVRLIETTGERLSPTEGRALWDSWHEQGIPTIWPKRCWPPY